MKPMTKLLTTLTLSLTVAGMANASALVAKDDSVTTDLCMKAASNNRSALVSAIKNSRLSKEFIVYNVKCNGENITDFVAQHGKSPEKMISVLNRGRHFGKVSIKDVASL